jgi:hypothetical protein
LAVSPYPSPLAQAAQSSLERCINPEQGIFLTVGQTKMKEYSDYYFVFLVVFYTGDRYARG